jgi:hypothetical protein
MQAGGIALQPKGGFGAAGGLPQPAANAGAVKRAKTETIKRLRMIATELFGGDYNEPGLLAK